MSATISDHYQRAVACLEAGALEDSLKHFEAFLAERPISGKAWNGAGTVLFRLGQHEKAAHYFRQSIEQQDRPAEAWRNLICTYLVLGQPAKAMRLLKTVDHEVHADVGLVCRTAGVFEQQSDLASAMSILQFGKRLDGDTAWLNEQIERLRARRAKIAFFRGDDGGRNTEAVIAYLQARYPVRIGCGRDAAEIRDLKQWSDICWFEGCGDVTAAGTSGPKTGRTIVRLHEDDVGRRPEAIDWRQVDLLVAGDPLVLHEARRQYPQLGRDVPVVTIPDGIDVERIAFKRRRQGRRIAVAGVGEACAEILQCAAELLRRRSEYAFYYRPEADAPAVREKMIAGIRRLRIEPWFHLDDVPADPDQWLEDMNFVISADAAEAGRATVLEAMAAGIKPVVRDLPGAGEVFGRNYLFRTPGEFCGKISEAKYHSEEYRYFVERKYPLSRQLLQMDEIFAGFELAAAGPSVPSPAGCPEDAVSAAV